MDLVYVINVRTYTFLMLNSLQLFPYTKRNTTTFALRYTWRENNNAFTAYRIPDTPKLRIESCFFGPRKEFFERRLYRPSQAALARFRSSTNVSDTECTIVRHQFYTRAPGANTPR